MSLLPNFIYRFNIIPIKVSTSYFVYIDKLVLKFTCRGKRPRTGNKILEKNKVKGLTLYNLENSHRVIVSKGLHQGSVVKNLPANAGDAGLISGSG